MRIDHRDVVPFLIGMVALPTQAILLRELLARCGGNEIVLTLALSLWLLGSAAGAVVWRRLPPLGREGSVPLILLGLIVAASGLVLARFVPMPGCLPGELPRPGAIAWLSFLVLFPAAFFTAGLFPVAAANPGRAYVLEALGAVLGGTLTTVLFVLRVPAIAILGGLGACVALASARKAGVIAAIAIGLILVSGLAGRIDDRLFRAAWETGRPGLTLVAHASTPQRTLALAEREGQRWLFADGALRATLDDPTTADATAALLASCAPCARSFLLVDFGTEGTAAALVHAGAARVLCLVPEREDTLLAPAGRGVECRVGDPRWSLRHVRGSWDVIAILGAEATSISSNRLWTEEAFHDMAARLTATGVVLAITAGGDAAPGEETRTWRASVGEAMRRSVGPLVAIDADRYVLAASRAKGDAALAADSLRSRFVRGGWRFGTYPDARFAVEYPQSRIVTPAPAAPNRDARPAALAHALARWGRMVGSRVHIAGWLGLLIPLVLLVLPVAASRREAPIVATGASAMGLDLLVLMAYQSRVGMLQAGLGLLLGAFLGGTAVGAMISVKRRASARALPAIALVQILIAAAAGPVLLHMPASSLAYAMGALILGVACGLPFPIVANETSASRAWAADAVGGVIGAIAVLFLVSRGLVTVGLALAIPPLAAMTRGLGSRGRRTGSARP
jgi:hypothetical protein